jgi:quercetin dioxygenase-like cupin family protein
MVLFRGGESVKIKSTKEVEAEKISEGVKIRWAISEKDGAENFYLRVIEIEPGGQGPPLHDHPYEHEMYILDGQGTVVGEDGEKPFKSGDVIFIPPNEKHQLKPKAALRFI